MTSTVKRVSRDFIRSSSPFVPSSVRVFAKRLIYREPPNARKLNLIICGAQRSGTTALKRALAEHPSIKFLGQKDNADLYYKGEYVGYPFATPFNAYSQVGDSNECYEEISKLHANKVPYIATKWPYFMVFPHIACNLRRQLPDAKLLFILRNPIDCLHSSFKMGNPERASDPTNFDSYVDSILKNMEDSWDAKYRGRWSTMLMAKNSSALDIDRGFYYPQLQNFYQQFPKSQIMVLNFQEFTSSPDKIYRSIIKWLGVRNDLIAPSLGTKVNASPSTAPMNPETRQKLIDLYERSNRSVCKLFGWDYDKWISY